MADQGADHPPEQDGIEQMPDEMAADGKAGADFVVDGAENQRKRQDTGADQQIASGFGFGFPCQAGEGKDEDNNGHITDGTVEQW